MIPKINSSHGAETRNLINRAIEVINRLGIDVQTLVANGQLTPEQYAELITIINGMIKSGEVSLNDLDPSVLEAINNGEGTPFEILSIPRDRSVSPTKTDFMTRNVGNLFDGKFLDKVMIFASSPTIERGLYTLEYYEDYEGRLAVIPIRQGETYTVSIHNEEFDQLRIGTHDKYPEFSRKVDYKISNTLLNSTDKSIREFTFISPENSKYMLISVSSQGKEPFLRVSKEDSVSEYSAPYIVPKYHIDHELINELNDIRIKNNGFLLEDPTEGYPDRPDANSVTWIGVNDPSEAEPYDEWRESPGFTYFFNVFDLIDNETFDYPWSTDFNLQITNTNYGQALEFGLNSQQRAALIIKKIKEDINASDSEIYYKASMRARSAYSSPEFGALFTASGGAGTESGYIVGPQQTDEKTMVAVTRFNGGNYHRLHETASGVDFTIPFHQRSRIDGDRIRAKFWQDGDVEPSNWLIDITVDASFDLTSNVGLFGGRDANYFYTLGIGTGGMRAPTRRWIQ